MGAKFTSGNVEPRWFVWKDDRYRIEEVNLYHRSFDGEAPIHHFSVSADGTTYHLIFDGKKLNWKLRRFWVK